MSTMEIACAAIGVHLPCGTGGSPVPVSGNDPMMMRMFRSLLLVVLMLVPAVATAQVVRSPYRYVDEAQSLSLFGGYMVTDEGKLGLGPESGVTVGLRYTLRIGGPFTAEATASYFPTTRSVFDTVAVGDPLVRVGEADIDLARVDAALRFNLTGPRTYQGVMPFLVAGGGVVFDVADGEGAGTELAEEARFDFGTRFAGQVGAGIEWFALRRVALRADARDVFWKLKTPLAFSRQDLDVPEDEWVQNFVFSLGIAYHF